MRSDRELWTEIRRQVLTKELSERAACRKYGLGWQTLKKILAHTEPPGYRQSQPRPKRKLESFLPIIHQILTDDRQAPKKLRHTAQRIFERLRDEYQFTGKPMIVKDAVRAWKQSHQEVFLLLSHPPGEAQVDFGEATISLNGQSTKVCFMIENPSQASSLAGILSLQLAPFKGGWSILPQLFNRTPCLLEVDEPSRRNEATVEFRRR